MKTRFPLVLACAGALAASTCAAALDKPWQQVSNPTAAAVEAHLAEPPAVYGPSVTFGWDGPLTREGIKRDFDALKARGFRVVTIEAGYHMDTTPYLSPEWFEMIRYAVGLAKERGMRVILIDEGKYPSGFVDGRFTRDRPDLRMQGIVVTDTVDVAGGEAFSRDAGPETLGALAVNQSDQSHQRIAVKDGKLSWTAPEGSAWKVYIVTHAFRTPQTRAVSDPTGAKTTANSMGDLLNPEAVRQLIRWTHEGYLKYLGDELGQTVEAFRGDEPAFGYLPYTQAGFDWFEYLKGYDVRPYVTSFVSLPGPRGQRPPAIDLTEDERRALADYYDAWSEMFAGAYFGQLGKWCADHGLEYTVHLDNEHVMERHVPMTGDFFRMMRPVQIPGVDSIWNQVWPGNNADFVKLASSAAHMYGRPRALSESFAAYNRPRPPNVDEARWGVNYQMARGISLFEMMFYLSSSKSGEARFHNYMADPAFPALADYTNRACYVLSQGRPGARIGLYFPTLSMWLGDYDSDATLMSIAGTLLEHQRDWDFVDEQGLTRDFQLDGGHFTNLSGQQYDAIVIPSITAISEQALARLEAFSKAGGVVICVGRKPSLVVGRTFRDARPAPDLPWAVSEPSGKVTDAVLHALPAPDLALEKPAPTVVYQHRKLADAELYFIFNQGSEPVKTAVTLEGTGKVQTWDLQTGKVSPLDGTTAQGDRTVVPLDLPGWGTQLIAIVR